MPFGAAVERTAPACSMVTSCWRRRGFSGATSDTVGLGIGGSGFFFSCASLTSPFQRFMANLSNSTAALPFVQTIGIIADHPPLDFGQHVAHQSNRRRETCPCRNRRPPRPTDAAVRSILAWPAPSARCRSASRRSRAAARRHNRPGKPRRRPRRGAIAPRSRRRPRAATAAAAVFVAATRPYRARPNRCRRRHCPWASPCRSWPWAPPRVPELLAPRLGSRIELVSAGHRRAS